MYVVKCWTAGMLLILGVTYLVECAIQPGSQIFEAIVGGVCLTFVPYVITGFNI